MLQQSAININRLANSTLMAMTGFLDWVNLSYIKGNDYQLLKLLFILLPNQNLKIATSECLLQVTGRKSESVSLMITIAQSKCNC